MAEKRRRSLWSRFASDLPDLDWRLHPLTLFILATIATIAVGIWLWRSNERDLLDRSTYQLTWDRLNVSPQPDFVRTDLKKAAFDGSRLGDLNLLDPALVSKVHAAFAVQSWVDQASVRKNRSGVEVDLTFRKPVALVEFGENLLLPVDRHGIVLDGEDFNPALASQFIRIAVDLPQVGSLVHGDVWPDERIVAAAMIADIIAEQARDWGVVRIAHVPLTHGSTAPEGDFEFLSTQGGAGIRVMWGSPPGFERPGEATPGQKVETLNKWVAERGALSDFGTSQTIDLRSGQVKLVSSN